MFSSVIPKSIVNMEGFLNKKGRGEHTFGRRNWKKRWIVVDGQYLNYYEDFDVKTGKPGAKKVKFLYH